MTEEKTHYRDGTVILYKENVQTSGMPVSKLRHFPVIECNKHSLAGEKGASVNMIEKHYSHIIPSLSAKELGGGQYEKKIDIC